MKQWLWPDIQDVNDAEKAAKTGGGVAIFLCIANGIIALIVMAGAEFIKDIIKDVDATAIFIEAGIYLLIGIFLFRKSRIAAVIVAVLYPAEQVIMMGMTGRFNFTAIFFGLCFINAVRGTFAYHNLRKLEDGEAASPPSMPGTEWPAAPQAATDNAGSEPQKKPGFDILGTIKWMFIGMVVLAALGGVLFMLPYLFPKTAQKKMGVSMPPIKMPSIGTKKSAETVKLNAAASADSGESSRAQKTFRLRNGQTVRGTVILNDPVYVTVRTLTGDEIVVREDIVEEN